MSFNENYYEIQSPNDWKPILDKFQSKPYLASEMDAHGMLPLHWACTEREIHPSILLSLLQLYPDAIFMKNNAGLLPLHIAIRAKLPPDTLQILLEEYPESITIPANDQMLPIDLAMNIGISTESLEILQKAYTEHQENSILNVNRIRQNEEELRMSIDHLQQKITQGLADLQLKPSTIDSPLRMSLAPIDFSMSAASSKSASSSEAGHPEDDGIPISGRKNLQPTERYSRAKSSFGSSPRGRLQELHVMDGSTSPTTLSCSPRHANQCLECGDNLSLFVRKYNCYQCNAKLCKLHAIDIDPSRKTKKFICRECRFYQGKRIMEANQLTTVVLERAGTRRGTFMFKEDDCYLEESSISNNGTRSIGEEPPRSSNQTCEDASKYIRKIKQLEMENKKLVNKLEEQERVNLDAMQLLTNTMQRVAELEMKLQEFVPDVEYSSL